MMCRVGDLYFYRNFFPTSVHKRENSRPGNQGGQKF